MRSFILLLLVCLFLFTACEKELGLSYLDNKKISEIGTKEEDNIILTELYDEILILSNEEPCTDITECDFVEIGAKPCGGPGGYIAYSTNINVVEFLVKVENYNDQKITYNLKWGILSDCSLPPVPTGLVCKDGKAVLEYNIGK